MHKSGEQTLPIVHRPPLSSVPPVPALGVGVMGVENERSMRENLERTLMMKNLTELNLQRQQQILNQAQQQQQH
ncbi:hypothetical protein ACLKA7_012292 [Drosophila subpalustris]